jgi:hypothetical protein
MEAAVRYVAHPFHELVAWRDTIQASAGPESVLFDVDEANNVVSIGVTDYSKVQEARNRAEAAGVPGEAVHIRYVGPGPHFRTSVNYEGGMGGTALWRASPGGASTVCTVGVTGYWGDTPIAITASHCSDEQFETDTTMFEQAFGGSSPVPALDEIWDPTYDEVDQACWLGGLIGFQQCRWSDTSMFEWRTGLLTDPYRIVRTMGSEDGEPGSREIDPNAPYFVVTDAMDSWNEIWRGRYLQKIGRTTGWTEGEIRRCVDGIDPDGQRMICNFPYKYNATCFNYVDWSLGKRLQCQFEAGIYSDSGDSGAPVFFDDPIWAIPDEFAAEIMGILWGGPCISASPDEDGPESCDENELISWFSPWLGVALDMDSGPALDVCHPWGNPWC